MVHDSLSLKVHGQAIVVFALTDGVLFARHAVEQAVVLALLQLLDFIDMTPEV